MNSMKNENQKEKKHRKYDKGQVFVKVMAGALALLMLVATSATLVFAILG